MTKQIIAVLGATGAQGGGLARAILDDEASLRKTLEGAWCIRRHQFLGALLAGEGICAGR